MSKKKIKPLSIEDQIYAKELIRVLDGAIRRVVRSYLGSELVFEFEDTVQTVYEKICEQLEEFKKSDNPEAFAVRIAGRTASHVRRDHKITELLSQSIPAPEVDRGLEDILPSSISDKDRGILTSVYEHQDTMVALADDLGCAPETLRQRLKRAKRRLKKVLEENP